MSLECRLEVLTEAHVEPYARLSRTEYGAAAAVAQPEHLRWKFLDNPHGPSTGVHLYDDGELVGRIVAMPRRFGHRGTSYTAAHLVDLLVHPDHRGMPALLRLVGGFKRLSGFDFVLSISPNQPEITQAFFKLPAHFELDVAVVPLRPLRLLHARGALPFGAAAPVVDWPWRLLVASYAAVAGSWRGVSLSADWPDAGELGAMLSGDGGAEVVGERTPEFLEWRYRRSPIFKYETRFLRRDGRLTGYFVTRRTVYQEYDCCFVVDAFARPGPARNDCTAATLSMLRQQAMDGAEMAMVIGNTRCGSLAAVRVPPFLPVPRRFWPRQAVVFAKWLSPAAFAFDPAIFQLTLGDYDAL